ncbi:MAG: helix-turn-helix transcriptional regulator [Oliverpabstia sp.]
MSGFSILIVDDDKLLVKKLEANGVMDESGILFEKRWFSMDGNIQTAPWLAWEKEMLYSGQLSDVQKSIWNFVETQQKKSGWGKNSLGIFLWDFRMMVYKYLDHLSVGIDEVFDSNEYNCYLQAASDSLCGVRELLEYVFEKLKLIHSCENRQDNVIDTLKLYIEQHIGDNLSRSILAKQVYLSEDYVSKVFMKATGMSITNYIAVRRIEKAKEYLKNTGHPISRIAVEVGYGNFSYFSKTFREQVGCTPNEYRSRLIKNGDS